MSLNYGYVIPTVIPEPFMLAILSFARYIHWNYEEATLFQIYIAHGKRQ